MITITLNQNDFTNLLTDFYTLFAPSKLENLPNLIEKYKSTGEQQLAAVKTAHVIYFQPKNPNYEKYKNIVPQIGTDKNILKLMEAYSRGERIISKEAAEQIQREQNVLIQEKQEQEEKEFLKKQEVEKNKQIEHLKEIETLKKELEFLKKQEPIKDIQTLEMRFEILNFLEGDKSFDYSNVIFPNKKFIPSLSVGQRLILKCKDGNIIGVEVVNINDEYIEDDNNPLRLLELKIV